MAGRFDRKVVTIKSYDDHHHGLLGAASQAEFPVSFLSSYEAPGISFGRPISQSSKDPFKRWAYLHFKPIPAITRDHIILDAYLEVTANTTSPVSTHPGRIGIVHENEPCYQDRHFNDTANKKTFHDVSFPISFRNAIAVEQANTNAPGADNIHELALRKDGLQNQNGTVAAGQVITPSSNMLIASMTMRMRRLNGATNTGLVRMRAYNPLSGSSNDIGTVFHTSTSRAFNSISTTETDEVFNFVNQLYPSGDRKIVRFEFLPSFTHLASDEAMLLRSRRVDILGSSGLSFNRLITFQRNEGGTTYLQSMQHQAYTLVNQLPYPTEDNSNTILANRVHRNTMTAFQLTPRFIANNSYTLFKGTILPQLIQSFIRRPAYNPSKGIFFVLDVSNTTPGGVDRNFREAQTSTPPKLVIIYRRRRRYGS